MTAAGRRGALFHSPLGSRPIAVHGDSRCALYVLDAGDPLNAGACGILSRNVLRSFTSALVSAYRETGNTCV